MSTKQWGELSVTLALQERNFTDIFNEVDTDRIGVLEEYKVYSDELVFYLVEDECLILVEILQIYFFFLTLLD